MSELTSFRVYASTPKSIEDLPYATLMNEVHIVLAFARDYDSSGRYLTGKFVPYFDSSFNAEKIQAIKNSARGTAVKFFLSIGGRKPEFPFQIPSGKRSEWVKAATQSLKDIINDYGFDGIDIYYEHIKSTTDFAKSIREVIWNLKRPNDKVISEASITVSAPLRSIYNDLYKAGPADFDHVVYQTHTETSRISTFDDLVKVFDKLSNYPKTKIFAGHSDVQPSDWANVPLPIFLGAVPKLLDNEINAISKWIVTPNDHNPEP